MQITIMNGKFNVTDLPPPAVKFKKFIFTYWREILKSEPAVFHTALVNWRNKLDLETCWSDGPYVFFQIRVNEYITAYFKISLTDIMMLPSMTLTMDSFNIEYVGLGCFMCHLRDIGEKNLQSI